VKGEKTLAELAQQFDVHPKSDHPMESPAFRRAAGVFGKDKSEAAASIVDLKSFAREDRRADAGERFLEGALTKAGLLSAKR